MKPLSHATERTKLPVFKLLKYGALIILGVLTLATFTISNEEIINFSSAKNLARLAVMVLFIVLLLATFRGIPSAPKAIGSKKYQLWTRSLCLILPCLAITFAAINLLLPEIGFAIVKGNGNANMTRPGIYIKMMCDLISFGILLYIAVKFLKTKNWLPLVVVSLLAIVLFWMAMEEISWGQRLMQWDTSDFFANNNEQSETNLHNLNTQLFQNVLYFGGFILLVVLPFFHDYLSRFFSRFKLTSWLPAFLPSAWLIGAFAAGIGFVDPAASDIGWRWSSILFALLMTGAILITYTWRLKRKNDRRFRQILVTLIAFLAVTIMSFIGEELRDIDHGAPTEYIELFIAFGILCWIIDLKVRFKSKSFNIIPAREMTV